MSQTTTDIVDHEETEELLDHAEENLTGVILGTITFLKERQLSVSDWAAHLGSQVAPTWTETGKSARRSPDYKKTATARRTSRRTSRRGVR